MRVVEQPLGRECPSHAGIDLPAAPAEIGEQGKTPDSVILVEEPLATRVVECASRHGAISKRSEMFADQGRPGTITT